MIAEAEKISISGIEYPIYSMDFTLGGGEKPSSLSVSFINKDGMYSKPALGVNNPIKIKIGSSFKFDGFPVSYSEQNSQQGKILNITYWDTSVKLDKIFVGLKGVHGIPPRNQGDKIYTNATVYGSFNNMLLLGNYIDPCENIDEEYIDPCNPCATISEFQQINNNNKEKLVDCSIARLTHILDVVYNFSELIGGLTSFGINFKNIPIVKEKYYSRYTGTAREVLLSWCSDLGLTFIWENNSVYFIDLKSGMSINDTDFYNACSLINNSISESIENVSSKGLILYFGSEGKLENYDCSSENKFRLSLIPITLKDLFWSNSPNGTGLQPYIKKYYTLTKTGENSIVPLQIACLLSNYSKIIRDMVLLYEYYDINEISNSLAGKKMPLVGMEIKEAWRVGTSDSSSDNAPTLKKIFYEYIPDSVRQLAIENGAGVAIIKYDQLKHEKFLAFESSLAKDFIGRYWISFFSDGENYSYSSPSGDPKYYGAGTPNTLPFSDLVPLSSQSISTFFQNLINDSAQKNKSSSHVGDVETTNPNSIAKSFILLDRQASWEPTPQSDDLVKINEDLERIYFYGTEPFKIEGEGDELADNEFYCLIFDRPDQLELIDFGIGNHPIEIDNENQVVELNGYNVNYGLRSALCKAYQLRVKNSLGANFPNWNHSINFFMPPQSSDKFGSEYPGFMVIASKNSGDSRKNILIEKKEVIFGDVPVENSESISISIDYKDITSIVSDILDSNGGVCYFDTSKIQQLITDYYTNTTRGKSVVQQTKSYTIGGFPTRELLLSDGLSGMSIRLSSDGITTDVSFSNLPPSIKKAGVQDQEFNRNIMRRLFGKNISLSNKKIIL